MPQDPSLTVAQQIDKRQKQFKAEWGGGRKPRIEDYLGTVQGEQRTVLFRALLAAEVELRQAQGERLDSAIYRQRFPDQFPAIAQLLQEEPEAPRARAGASPHATVSTIHVAHGAPTMSIGGAEQPTVSATMPAKVGRFEIISLLGEGAFGKVFRARDPQLDREVAVKMPRAGALESARDLERFQREAKAAATIQHPNICPVYEIGQEGDSHYIVMAYVPGQSLADNLKSRKTPMAPRQAALMVRKLALALHAAHEKGIVHRDLKPGNILIDGERKELVITDFGLARRTRAEEAQLTQSGAIMGTPSYMAPEQARGEGKAVGPWSDVYSLGVILYEMLAGQRPFQGSVAEVIGKLLHVEPQPPSMHRPNLDPKIEAICLKAMAKDDTQRYRSMKELAGALGEYLKGTAQAEGKAVASAEATVSGRENGDVTELIRELSAERKAENEALVKAAVAGARVPFWAWLAGAGFMAAVVLLGIIFFARTPTTTVLIQIDVDLKDKSLSFFLDSKPTPAEELDKPIELKVGEHELLVKRKEEIVRRYRFSVKKEGGPRIELKEEEQKPEVTPIQEPGYTPLFNGKDLTGWKTHPGAPGDWKVENGLLVGRGPKRSHLFTERDDYADFHFLVEAKINTKGNSGQQFRCKFGPNLPNGYEAQIDSGSHPNKTGTLYVLPSQRGSFVKEVLVPPDTWFTQEVIARGNRIVIKVNDKVVTDFVDENRTYGLGSLALQVFDPDTEVHFKRVLVRELNKDAEEEFTYLFNFKDLTGWEGQQGVWEAKTKTIFATTFPDGSKQNTFLCSKQAYKNFELVFDAKIRGTNNSGVMIRSELYDRTNFWLNGIKCDLGSRSGWGTLVTYDGKNGRILKSAKGTEAQKSVNADDFNRVHLRCVGQKVTVKLNGELVHETELTELAAEGVIGFQLRYGDPTEVTLKNIRIRKLK